MVSAIPDQALQRGEDKLIQTAGTYLSAPTAGGGFPPELNWITYHSEERHGEHQGKKGHHYGLKGYN